MRSLLGFVHLIAAVITALLLPMPAMAIEMPAEVAPVVYGYDARYVVSESTSASTERGPPEADDSNMDYDADDQGLVGALARPNAGMSSATYDYDDLGLFVQAARGSHGAEPVLGRTRARLDL
jgi:hypothetical protein